MQYFMKEPGVQKRDSPLRVLWPWGPLGIDIHDPLAAAAIVEPDRELSIDCNNRAFRARRSRPDLL